MDVYFLIPYLVIALGLPTPVVHSIWTQLPERVQFQWLINALRARYLWPLLKQFNNQTYQFWETSSFALILHEQEPWGVAEDVEFRVQSHPTRRYFIQRHHANDLAHVCEGSACVQDQEEFLTQLTDLLFWFDLINSVLVMLKKEKGTLASHRLWNGEHSIVMVDIGTITVQKRDQDSHSFTLVRENGQPLVAHNQDRLDKSECLIRLTQIALNE